MQKQQIPKSKTENIITKILLILLVSGIVIFIIQNIMYDTQDYLDAIEDDTSMPTGFKVMSGLSTWSILLTAPLVTLKGFYVFKRSFSKSDNKNKFEKDSYFND